MSVINALAYIMGNTETLIANATVTLDTLINELENRKELKKKHSERERERRMTTRHRQTQRRKGKKYKKESGI